MQFIALLQPFHRLDRSSWAFCRQFETAQYRFSIDEDGAGAALPQFAAVLRSCQAHLFTEYLQERMVHGKDDVLLFTVDLKSPSDSILRHFPPIGGTYSLVGSTESMGREGPGTSCQVPMIRFSESTLTTRG